MNNNSWTQESTDGELAKFLRRDIRLHRREKGKGGHRYRYDDLTGLMVNANRDHVAATHLEDKHWQHWWRDGNEGWKLQGSYTTLASAQEAAEAFTPMRKPPLAPRPASPGLYVRATWPRQERPRGIRVKCSTPRTAEVLTDIFTRLGYETKQEKVLVGAPVDPLGENHS